ncbi:hypothetical protein HFO27_36135 [Rhizobium leguminosarum]|uniref:hypothetical protein n=1 Tax=Rhizobium leguminosarum TaxID=384 RepID=UPI001C91DF6F|nr:hypothetical protein [Rhizobium leguminosarum]MBY3179886.1 hypothetical protein [Rhizobium leguminosarum]
MERALMMDEMSSFDFDVVELSPEEACAISGGFIWAAFFSASALATFAGTAAGTFLGYIGAVVVAKKWHMSIH